MTSNRLIKSYATVLITFFLSAVLIFCSCGGEEEPTLVGSWSGVLVQPVFGDLRTEFRIENISLDAGRGQGTFTSRSEDITNCDDSQFICEPLFCNFDLKLLSIQGSLYEFDQLVEQGTTCGDGVFEITLLNDDEINVVWYEEPFPDNRATGKLTKN